MKESMARNESVEIPIIVSGWEERHGITMCIITLNEEREIKECLEHHRPYVDKIVMIDGGSTDKTTRLAAPLVDNLIVRKFDGHYSNQANRAIENVKTDWILLVDSDERFGVDFLKRMRGFIDQEVVDCYSFPRTNYIDGVLIKDPAQDYQERLYRSYCRRIRPVHGEVVGYKNKVLLPCEEGNFIIHKKTRDRHELRNKLYALFELKFINEMGEPGSQALESFYEKFPYLRLKNFSVK
jgi:glycosyltransferase involved in cell wall biosynthesis